MLNVDLNSNTLLLKIICYLMIQNSYAFEFEKDKSDMQSRQERVLEED